MSPDTVRALRAINERFYRTHAAAFAAKRTRPWPGMERLLRELPKAPATALDVGCGHGRLAALLASHHPRLRFTGVDGSEALLERARARDDVPVDASWLALDLEDDPEALPSGPFDLVTLIAVLHHVPGEQRRAALLRTLASRVAPGGVLALAFWRQVGDAERRRVPWSRVDLDERDVEPGDRLTRFGAELGDRLARFGAEPGVTRFGAEPGGTRFGAEPGGTRFGAEPGGTRFSAEPDRPRSAHSAGLRYAHFADEAELDRIESAPGLPLRLRYVDDGPDQHDNAYFLWQRAA